MDTAETAAQMLGEALHHTDGRVRPWTDAERKTLGELDKAGLVHARQGKTLMGDGRPRLTELDGHLTQRGRAVGTWLTRGPLAPLYVARLGQALSRGNRLAHALDVCGAPA